MDTTTKQAVALDGIGSMIEDQKLYEEATALSLLSLAYSGERIAAALEQIAQSAGKLGDCVEYIYDQGNAIKTYETYR